MVAGLPAVQDDPWMGLLMLKSAATAEARRASETRNFILSCLTEFKIDGGREMGDRAQQGENKDHMTSEV